MAPALLVLATIFGLFSLFLLYVAGSNWRNMRKHISKTAWTNYRDAFYVVWIKWAVVFFLLSIACFYAGVYTNV